MDDMTKGIGYCAKEIHDKMEFKTNLMLKAYGLTMTQYQVIRYLDDQNKKGIPVKQKDLENHFHISNPTVSVMLDRLEIKDLIVRTRAEEDKRIRYVVLTDKTQSLLDEILKGTNEAEAALMQGIEEEEIQNGMAFLQKILCNLDRIDDEKSKEDGLND